MESDIAGGIIALLVMLFTMAISLIPCILFMLFYIFLFAVIILGTAFWIWMLIDLLRRPINSFKNENDRIGWILVLVFTQWIGAIIYYFLIYKKEMNKHESR